MRTDLLNLFQLEVSFINKIEDFLKAVHKDHYLDEIKRL